MGPLVSVIVPVYNAHNYLVKCIESILNQQYKNLEIIAVNDGSIDDSLSILNDFASKDSRIVVIDKLNGGVSSARNCGLKVAHGEYVSFIDCDDYIEKDLYFDLIPRMIKNSCDCAMFEYFIDYPDKTIIHTHKSGREIIDNISALNYTITPVNRFSCSKIFSKKIIENLQFDEKIFVGEDTLFGVSSLIKANNVLFVDKPYYHYFQNTNSATGGGYNTRFLTSVDAYEKIKELVSFNDSLSKVALSELLMFVIINVVGLYGSKEYSSKREVLIEYLRKNLSAVLFNSNIKLSYKFKAILCSLMPNLYSNIINLRKGGSN